MHPRIIQKLIDLFAKFPTIGPRTAARFVFYLLKLSKEEIETLTSLIFELKNTIKTCKSCFSFFEPTKMKEGELEAQCEICQDIRRDKTLLCIVEKETDLIPIEKTKRYKGFYFILGGLISYLKGEENKSSSSPKEDVKKLRTRELLERVKNSEELKEIIIAINPTIEGETTALYLERQLKFFAQTNKKITRLGQGLPVGAELEYTDKETLSSALEGRK